MEILNTTQTFSDYFNNINFFYFKFYNYNLFKDINYLKINFENIYKFSIIFYKILQNFFF